jgi:hypothetical protein
MSGKEKKVKRLGVKVMSLSSLFLLLSLHPISHPLHLFLHFSFSFSLHHSSFSPPLLPLYLLFLTFYSFQKVFAVSLEGLATAYLKSLKTCLLLCLSLVCRKKGEKRGRRRRRERGREMREGDEKEKREGEERGRREREMRGR